MGGKAEQALKEPTLSLALLVRIGKWDSSMCSQGFACLLGRWTFSQPSSHKHCVNITQKTPREKVMQGKVCFL